MYTLANAVHRLPQRIIDLQQLPMQRFFLMNRLQGSHLQNCTGKHMTHIVVDFPRNAVSLLQCSKMNLIILFFHQFLLSFLHHKTQFGGTIL